MKIIERQSLLTHLMELPGRILRHHHIENLRQVVLHTLAHQECFNFKRAAYFVDNPDFDHLRGAAGYCGQEAPHHPGEAWENPEHFLKNTDQASFRQQIGSILQRSLKKNHIDIHNEQEVEAIGKKLGMESPRYIAWDGKHGNYGILIYEEFSPLSQEEQELLKKATSLLSFCPL